jgi:hypothetical protein
MLSLVAVAVILVLSPSQASVSQHNPFYCFATDPIKPQNTMFSTKTAYEAARGNFDFSFRSSRYMEIIEERLSKSLYRLHSTEVLHVQPTWIKIAIVR